MKNQKTLLAALFSIIVLNCMAQGLAFNWAKQFAGSKQVTGTNIEVDSIGNVYIAGEFEGTVDMDPGPGTKNLTSAGQLDIFLAKYTSTGDLVWCNKFGAFADDNPKHLVLDHMGHLYMTGGYKSTVDFDPGIGYSALTSTGFTDFFIAKYDTSGAFIWVKGFGGINGEDMGRSLALDAGNNIFVTGQFSGTIYVASDTLQSQGSSVYSNIFICRMDASGNFIWAKGFGNIASDLGYNILTDGTGNIVVSGVFGSIVDFDPGSGIVNLGTPTGSRNIFFAKYTSQGSLVYAKEINGGGSVKNVFDMKSGPKKSIYLCGEFESGLDFDPDSTNHYLFAKGKKDGFLMLADSSGNLVWVNQMKGLDNVEAENLVVDAQGNVTVSGSYYQDSLEITSTSGSVLFPNLGYYDLFIAKFDTAGKLLLAKALSDSSSESSFDMELDANNNLYMTGIFYGASDFDLSDSVFTMNCASGFGDGFIAKYGVCTQTYSTENLSGCGQVAYNNISYSASGTYFQFLQNSSGCDSVITLNVTIKQNTFSTISANACKQYASPSGVYTWTVSGTYQDTILNAAACDSILTINLTIYSVDTSVVQAGAVLTANANGAIYQWLDCGNGYAQVAGATSQSFSPAVNGAYAVMVTQNGCTDTSACHPVAGIGIIENSFGYNLSVYPNPTKEVLSIGFEKTYEEMTIKIKNTLGQIVSTTHYKNVNSITTKIEEESGIYLMEIKTDSGQYATIRILKY